MRLSIPRALRAARTLGLATLMFAGACNNSGTLTSDASRVTETFSGVLAAGSSSSHTLTVMGSGNLDMTLASLAPQTTITVGLGVGLQTTTGCGLLYYTDSAHVGSVVSGGVDPGAYCVGIYDVGNVQGSASYSLTVVHP